MIRIVYGVRFLKCVKAIPVAQRRKLAKLLETFSDDPYHPTLHTKKLSGKLFGFLSFRISRDWRIMFQFIDAETIQLVDAAHRKDVYR